MHFNLDIAEDGQCQQIIEIIVELGGLFKVVEIYGPTVVGVHCDFLIWRLVEDEGRYGNVVRLRL